MKETEMQQLIIDAVKKEKGFAFKMSNRFLIGVVDLFVKLPREFPSAVIEVKRYDHGPRPVPMFLLDVTVSQKRFLRDAHKAGTPAGVASFMQQTGKGLKSLQLHIYTLEEIEELKYMAMTDDHEPLGHPNSRNMNIVKILGDWFLRGLNEKINRREA